MTNQFPVDREITAIAMAYRNPRLISDDVLPRFGVGKKNYAYMEYDLSAGFTLPNTMVGRTSVPDEVSIPSVQKDRSVKDFGLDDLVPNDDLDNTPNGKTLLSRRAEFLTDLILLDREVRVARIIHDPASYLPANVEALTTPWTDASTNPIGTVNDMLDRMMIRPNVMVFGRELWTIFAQHPKIVKACNRNDGGDGFAKRDEVAALFEIEKVLVGDAMLNINRKGQDPQFKRAWGKKLSLHYLDVLGGPSEKPSFGFTAQYSTRAGGTMPEPKLGLRGSTRVRVGESVDEVIAAPALGALFEHP